MTPLLTYGLFEGQLTHISTVKNGLSCGCICPNCKTKLVAKNNADNIIAPHFAHFEGLECKGAFETALHLLAKEVMLELKRLLTPDFHYDYNRNKKVSFFQKGEEIKFDEVLLEQVVHCEKGVIVADAVGRIGEERIYIEFANTHFSSADKIQKLKKLGVATIEISLANQPLDKESLAKFFLQESQGKYWLSNPELDRKYQNKLQQRREEAEQRKVRAEQIFKLNQDKLNSYRLTSGINVFEEYYGRIVDCPKKSLALHHLKSESFYSHPILKKIIDGKYWDGMISRTFSTGKYIDFDGKKEYVFLPDKWYKNGEISRLKDSRLFYAGLLKIQTIIDNSEFGNCRDCKFSKESLQIRDKAYEICCHPEV